MIYDAHPDQGSKWSRAFWVRGYYVATVGNITEVAIKRYLQEQQEEAKEEKNKTFFRGRW
jgi:putative transposase